MRLKDVVVQGRACGLKTVGECVANFELHMMYMLPHSEVPREYKELLLELSAYEDGELELDWEWINTEVTKLLRVAEERVQLEDLYW